MKFESKGSKCFFFLYSLFLEHSFLNCLNQTKNEEEMKFESKGSKCFFFLYSLFLEF